MEEDKEIKPLEVDGGEEEEEDILEEEVK